MAKFGIALGSGPRGLGFESRYSDHTFLYEPVVVRINAREGDQIRKLTQRVGFFILDGHWDSKDRPEQSEGKKQSGGLFLRS